MPQRRLRIGIAGAGHFGRYHALKVAASERAELVGIHDPDEERAKTVGWEAGAPSMGFAPLLAASDALVVAAPAEQHHGLAAAALRAGRHVLVEKPIAATLAEADELIDLARANGLCYVVAPPNMLQANRQQARRLVAAGAIGQPCFARVRSSHGGPAAGAWPLDPTWFYQEGSGPLFDMGVYGIHDITGILGPAKRVVAFSGITEKVRTVRAGPFAGKSIEVTADDNTLLMLDFGNSTFAVVDGTFNVNAAKSPQIEIFGRSGTINLNNQTQEGSPPLEIFRFDAAPGIDGWITPRGGWSDSERQRYRRAILVKHLADCLANGTPPVAGAEHARHALEIMVKAIESARSGCAIDLQTTF
ncbi:MAG TPA: Gfo/Idh/MocA family oxidoreductase [Chloroflexota bacterium]|nr:Gfo/Idh/MocA family oxidoreductase [Chloroflexota bacterium]